MRADPVRALGEAMRARELGEVSRLEWSAEFSWHRAEDDLELALAAAPGIMRRLRAAGYVIVYDPAASRPVRPRGVISELDLLQGYGVQLEDPS